MNYELNRLIDCYSGSFFQVKDIYRYRVPAGRKGRQKTLPLAGMVFPLSGKVQFDFNGTPYIADNKKVLHGGADMILDKKVLGNSALEYISIMYEIDNKKNNEICLMDSHFELEVGYSPRLNGLLNRLWKISHIPGKLSEFQKETLFRCILEEIFICNEKTSVHHDRDLYGRISEYIHEHYGEPLAIGELAQMYEVNGNRLYYLFTKYAGMGPGDYLITYRLNRAKELLLTTEAPINDIAKAVGYEDPLYFSRIFQKRIGCSPMAFRKKIRNNP